jgi:hypothetical protein
VGQLEMTAMPHKSVHPKPLRKQLNGQQQIHFLSSKM